MTSRRGRRRRAGARRTLHDPVTGLPHAVLLGEVLDEHEHEQAAADTLAGRVPMMFALPSRPLVLRPIAVRADGKFYQGRPGRAPVQCAPTRLVRPGMHQGRDP